MATSTSPPCALSSRCARGTVAPRVSTCGPTTLDLPIRSLRLLQLVALTSTLDRFCVAPMLAVIAHDFGVSLAGAVTVATVYFLAYGVMQPVWGLLCDRLGRVRTLRAALLLTAAVGVAS